MDDSPVKATDHECTVKGIGNSMTTVRDLTTESEVHEAFLILAEMVASRARKKGLQGKTVAIWLRDSKLEWITRQAVLPRPTYISDEIAQCAMKLYHASWDAEKRPVRAVGIRVTTLSPIEKYTQLCFFDVRRQKLQSLEFTKDDITRASGRMRSRALRCCARRWRSATPGSCTRCIRSHIFRNDQPGGHASARPPSRCTWRWSTDCPPSRPVLMTSRKPLSSFSSLASCRAT